MNTYNYLNDVMQTARREAAGKPLQNNTRLFRRGPDVLAVRLHATDVVTVWEDSRVALDSGGWQTMTTKDRMNGYAPVRISSVKGTWYVSHDLKRQQAARQAREEFDVSGGVMDPRDFNYRALYRREAELCEVPYFDGIMFDAEGNCLNGIDPETWASYQAVVKEREAAIQKYCSGFYQALKRGMNGPSGGDCWYCSMRDDNGITWGDHGDIEHLLSHLSEPYYVPSLVFNAMRESGYKDVGVAIHLGYDPDTGRIGGPIWAKRQSGMGGGMVRRDLRNYLRRRLIPDPPSERNGFTIDSDAMPLDARNRVEMMAARRF